MTTNLPATLDLGDSLAHMSETLQVPVLVASIVLLLLCAGELGRFATESLRRHRTTHGTLRLICAQALIEPGVARHVSERAPSAIAAAAVREVDKTTGKIEPRSSTAPATTTTTVPQQQPGPTTSGQGNAIGTLYRLADGRLVVVKPGGKAKPVSP